MLQGFGAIDACGAGCAQHWIAHSVLHVRLCLPAHFASVARLTSSLPRNNVRLVPAVSTVRILPDFECDDVPLLPEGAVLPWNNSSESRVCFHML